MSSHAARLGLDQSDHSRAIVVNVPATFAARTASSTGGRLAVAGAAARGLPPHRRVPAGVELDVDQRPGTPRMPQNRASGP